MAGHAEKRERMVERQLRRRGITDERVLEAMATIPRERFVPEAIRDRAYADAALPIGHGQTISQPWIVAAICQALELKGGESVLEIGGGSGYSAAILAHLAERVTSIELIPELARSARDALAEIGLGPERIEVVVGDGSLGRPGGGAVRRDRRPRGRARAAADAPAPAGPRRAAGGAGRIGAGRGADPLRPRSRPERPLPRAAHRPVPVRPPARR